MITITKQGIVPKEGIYLYKVLCPTCGTEFECERDDFTRERRMGGNSYIICPTCKNRLEYSPIELLNIRINI